MVYNPTMDIILVAVGLQGICLLLAAFLLKRYLDRTKKRAIETLKLYFEQPDAQTPSEFAKLTVVLSDQLASSIVSSIRAQLMQAASVQSRNEKKLDQALTQDLVSNQMPLAGLALQAFPGVSKLVQGNPAFLALLQKMIPAGPGSTGSPAPVPSNGSGKNLPINS